MEWFAASLVRWMARFGKAETRRYINAFAGTYVLLVIVGTGIFMPTTILSNSKFAREMVEIATAVFPWLDNIRVLGSRGERGLVIHSLVFLSSVFPAVLIFLTKQPENGESLERMFVNSRSGWSLFAGCTSIAIAIGIYIFPRGLQIGFYENVGFVDPVGAAIIALSAAAMFWDGVSRLIAAASSIFLRC